MTRNDDGGLGSEEEQTRDHNKQWRQAVQRHYDPDQDGELTTAIIFAIAEAEDVEPDEIKSPSLYEVVDVPSIEAAIFGPESEAGSRQDTSTVKFHYTDYLVKIRSDGWIQVCERTEPEQP